MDQQPPKAVDTDQINKTPTPASSPKPDPSPNGDGTNWGSFVMGSDSLKTDNQTQPHNKIQSEQSTNQTEPSTTASVSRKSVHWSSELVTGSHAPTHHNYDTTMSAFDGANLYVAHAPAQPSSSFSFKDTIGNVKDVLGRWGKKVGEATRKAEDLAGNTWQHLKTSPSFADAAMGRIAQGTKVLAEGGYEKIFRQTFETVPEE